MTEKIQSQPGSTELFYLVGMLKMRSPGERISVALRKLLQGGGKESQAVYMFATTDQAIWTLKIKYQVKEFSLLCMERCKPLGSLNSFLSYASQLSGAKSCFLFHLVSCIPPALQLSAIIHGGWRHPLDHNFRSSLSCLETRNHWWLWQFLIIDMAGDIFISQCSE